jgi:hypothetical protein
VELSAYRGAARLLAALLPSDPVSRTTLRNGTHRVAADLERLTITKPNPKPAIDPAAEMMVLIDGAQIRAAHGDPSRHLDLMVGKIEVTGSRQGGLLLHRRVRNRRWRHCAMRFETKDGSPGHPVTV